ncbi:MAG: energy-dependent translational throttle protein EttA [Candidatus Delongbacteria bacterium]
MSDQKVIFSMIGVGKVLRDTKRQILRDIYLGFYYGAKIGVLGLNGSGKSTLLKIIAGLDTDIVGEIVAQKGLRFGYLPQEPQLEPGRTVRETVTEGAGEAAQLLAEFNAISEQFADPDADFDKLIARQGVLQEKIDHLGAWDLDSKLEQAMDALRCPDPETLVDVLSGGEKRRVALCRLLLSAPDVLLLDEPTNHLDAESVAWLEQYLARYPGTVLAVTHDRYFLDNVAGWILELDRGHGIPFEGNYSSWLEQKSARLAAEEKQESKRRKALEHELEWVRQSPKARHDKSKARIARFEEMSAQQTEKVQDDLEIFIPANQRLGGVVIEAKGLGKGYDGRLLFDNLTFSLPPGGIVGVIGANGAGKTTLFRLITGQETPDSGEIRVGETVTLGYVDQSRPMNPEDSIYTVISGGQETLTIGNRELNARAWVGRFNFSGQDQQKPVGLLSGGERGRVHLARTLREGANVLLLDEPTNDLDVNTLRALEEGLLNFAGCAVVISHDRWFLDRIASHILAFEGDSQVVFFEGNFSDYEKNRKERGLEAGPHRIKYRQLTR